MITPVALVSALALWSAVLVDDPSRVSGKCSITLQSAIGKGGSGLLLCAQGLAPLGDGRVAVSDRLDYRMKLFGPDGIPLASVGGRGKSDGQFRGPGPVDCSPQAIAVADFASGRIQIFSRSLHHIRTLEVPGAVSDLCYDRRGALWASIIGRDNRGGLLRYSPDGAVCTAVPLRSASGNPFHDVCVLAATPDSAILAAYLTRNIIEIYDSSGNLVNQFAVPGMPVASPVTLLGTKSDPGPLEVPLGVLIWNVTVDEMGRIFVLGGEFAQRPGREITLVDPAGRFLQNLLLPERAVRIRADGATNLWAVPASRDCVMKYRINSWSAP